jgi:cardiolipin synthase A/B
MRVIVQPDDGVAPLVEGLQRAKTHIDIVIFRFDIKVLEVELREACARGVAVRALVAHTNGNGDAKLRAMEQRLLDAGVRVSRTNDDLVRYHAKLLVVDRQVLYVLGFNFTGRDLNSRSFGIVSEDAAVVRDVVALIEADIARSHYRPRSSVLVVSPDNARLQLTRFLANTRQSLDVYDPNLTDDAMLALLKALALDGVAVRILGRIEHKWLGKHFEARPFPGKRLHVRAILRDQREVFVGTQSLRKMELEKRREVGLIVSELGVVERIQAVFQEDWRSAEAVADE